MRCPWCGSPVMIRGSRWECGFCGDSGDLKFIEQPDEEEDNSTGILLTFSVPDSLDLPETWEDMKHCLQQLAGNDYSRLLPRMAGAFLYEITDTLIRESVPETDNVFSELETFLKDCREIPADIGKIRSACRSRIPLCREDGILDKKNCGAFWQALIPLLPAEQDFRPIDGIFSGLSDIESYLPPDAADSDQDPESRLQDAFEVHWAHHRYFSPDASEAVRHLHMNDTSFFDDDCRDILVSAFPGYFSQFSQEELADFQLSQLMEELFCSCPSLAAEMWQKLLNAVGPDFGKNTQVRTALWDSCPLTPEDWEAWQHAL